MSAVFFVVMRRPAGDLTLQVEHEGQVHDFMVDDGGLTPFVLTGA